jgi:phytoene dehydrogenase-like protein
LLGSWFDSDALKAVLAFDATADGLSIDEPASALALLWRAAQENAGLQAASGVLRGGCGVLTEALVRSARTSGVEIRTGARVLKITAAGGKATGIELQSGESFASPVILSGLSKAGTYALLPPGAAGIAEQLNAGEAGQIASARISLILDRKPSFGGSMPSVARLVFAERLESYAIAHEAARAGRFSDELVFEAVACPIEGGTYELSVLVRPVPATFAAGWREAGVLLTAKIIAALSACDRGLKESIRHIHISTPEDLRQVYAIEPSRPPTAARFLSSFSERIATPVEGLFLCGVDSEPLSAVSGRGARLAATQAISWLREAVGGGRS